MISHAFSYLLACIAGYESPESGPRRCILHVGGIELFVWVSHDAGNVFDEKLIDHNSSTDDYEGP